MPTIYERLTGASSQGYTQPTGGGGSIYERLTGKRQDHSFNPDTPEEDGIFSGNFLSDVGDVIGAMGQYPLVGLVHAAAEQRDTGKEYDLGGMLKGAWEGIKHRARWQDVLKDHDLFGVDWNREIEILGRKVPLYVPVGLVMDLAVDPLNMAPVRALYSSAIKGAGKGALKAAQVTGISKALKSIPLPETAIKFLDRYSDYPLQGKGRTIGELMESIANDRPLLEQVMRLDDARIVETSRLMEDAIDVTREMQKAPRPVWRLWHDWLTTGDEATRASLAAEAAKAGLDEARFLELADKGSKVFPKLGEQLVELGALKPESLKPHYLPRLFERFEDPSSFLKRLHQADPERAAELAAKLEEAGFVGKGFKLKDVEMAFLEQRQDLPEELLEELGEIKNAPYLIARGASAQANYIAKSNFYRNVADTFAKKFTSEGAARLAGYAPMPANPMWGALAGQYVPEVVHRYLTGTFAKTNGPFQKALSLWKFGKVALNPATHVRNLLANQLLIDWGEGLTPLSPNWWKYTTRAAKALLEHNDDFKQAKNVSTFLVDTFRQTELPALLRDPKARLNQNSLIGLFGWLGSKTGAFTGKMADLYQFEEQLGKMTVYLHRRDQLLKQGMSLAEAAAQAAKQADDWLFNYRKVPRWVDMLRSGTGPLGILGAVPFITFPYKAAPKVAQTLLEHPERIAKYYKFGRGVEALSDPAETQEERRAFPDWMKSGAWIKLPGKDKYGRSLYFDASYIVPLADLPGGKLVGEGQQASVVNTPFFNILADLTRNRSRFTGKPIWDPNLGPVEVAKQIGGYLSDQLLPSLLGGYGTKNIAAALARKPDWLGRTRPLSQVIAAQVLGLKTRPINADEETAWRLQEYEAQIAEIEKGLERTLASPAISDEYKERAWETATRRINDILAEMEEAVDGGSP